MDISKADYCPVLGHLIHPIRQHFNLSLEEIIECCERTAKDHSFLM